MIPQDLAPGERRYVQHTCGAGRKLIVSRDGPRISWFCVRCHESGAQRVQESTEQMLVRLRKQAAQDSTCSVSMPEPRVYSIDKWPPGAALWLYKAGLSRARIGELGIYYHPDSDRVVIPVGENFYQARAYQPGRTPKYLSPHPRPKGVHPVWGAGPAVVLTEDVLSAVKVSAHIQARALIGTSLSEEALVWVLAQAKPVLTWLDPDDAGQTHAAPIRRKLRSCGVQVANIVSSRDPKLHSLEEIHAYIHDGLRSLR